MSYSSKDLRDTNFALLRRIHRQMESKEKEKERNNVLKNKEQRGLKLGLKLDNISNRKEVYKKENIKQFLRKFSRLGLYLNRRSK
jgi:hypothetical protein